MLKTTRDIASSSFLDAAWDINKTDIAVGAAAWRTRASCITLGNLIIEQIINITIGNPISFIIKPFFIDIILVLILEIFESLNHPRLIPTTTRAKTITILEGIQSNAAICSFHGDNWMITAPISPLIAGLLNIVFRK